MVRKAKELADKHGWFLARQFENEANPAYHRSTTGPEILRDFAGKRLDYFVSGWGTGGTITGAGEVLKLARPGHQGDRQRAGRRGAAVGQGMAAAQDPGLDAGLPAGRAQPHDRRRDPADRRRAWRATPRADWPRRKACSSAFPPAPPSPRRCRSPKRAPEGSVLLAMLPDTGERYLSTFLFEGVSEGSDDEWLASLEAGCRAA